MKTYPIIAVLVAPALAACASPAARRGYADVEATAGGRLTAPLRLQQPRDSLAVQERTKALLTGGPLTAEGAVELALLNSPALGAQTAEIAVARAELAQGSIIDNPRLHYSLRQGSGQRGYEFSATMNFMDLVSLPLKRRLAGGRYEQARLRVSQEVLDLAAEVKADFYEAQAAAKRAALSRVAYESFQAQAELVDRQRKAGNISALDHARETAAAEQSAVELAHAEAEADQARERLAAAMGAQDLAPFTVAPEAAQPPASEPPLDKLEQAALAQRWDLDAARREPAILKEELLLDRLNLFGPVTAGYDAEKGLGEPRGGGPTVEFGVPLFDRRQASSARLTAERTRSELTLASLEAEIRLEVRVARSQLAAARLSAERYRTSLIPLTQRVAEETLRNYDFMLLGVYDVLRARREQFQAQREYADSLRDYWTAWARLERAVGGKVPPELAAVPSQPQQDQAAPQQKGDTP